MFIVIFLSINSTFPRMPKAIVLLPSKFNHSNSPSLLG